MSVVDQITEIKQTQVLGLYADAVRDVMTECFVAASRGEQPKMEETVTRMLMVRHVALSLLSIHGEPTTESTAGPH
jgi:hypothetical protein